MVYRTAEYEANVPEIESVDSRALTQLLITGEKSLRTYTFMTRAPASGNAPEQKGTTRSARVKRHMHGLSAVCMLNLIPRRAWGYRLQKTSQIPCRCKPQTMKTYR